MSKRSTAGSFRSRTHFSGASPQRDMRDPLCVRPETA